MSEAILLIETSPQSFPYSSFYGCIQDHLLKFSMSSFLLILLTLIFNMYKIFNRYKYENFISRFIFLK